MNPVKNIEINEIIMLIEKYQIYQQRAYKLD
jgi:hypothetical protein